MNRRLFLTRRLPGLASYALLGALAPRELFAAKVAPVIREWVRSLDSRCADLRRREIGPAEWQDAVEPLLRRVPMPDLLAAIDFEALDRRFEFPDLGAGTEAVRWPELVGLPEGVSFFSKIFGLSRGRAIIPHGHRNMVSAHLVLEGSFALRHYDRVEEEPEHLIVRPTIDREIKRGDCSSISDERDNVHWFVTTSGRAYTLDVIMTGVDPGVEGSYEIHNLDPVRAEKLDGGLLRMPRLGVEAALERYGKTGHHGGADS